MKKVLMALVLITSLMYMGCNPLVKVATTTHKQVMEGYKTKDQVVGKFGIPTSKRNDGDYEEYYYLFGVKTVTDKNASLSAIFGGSKAKSSTTSVDAASFGGLASGSANGSTVTNSAAGGNANASARSISQEVKTYVKFTFKGDNVVTWESNGVDYGIYEMKKKKK